MTLEEHRDRMLAQGFDPVVIMPNGCPLKERPHVCANCPRREDES